MYHSPSVLSTKKRDDTGRCHLTGEGPDPTVGADLRTLPAKLRRQGISYVYVYEVLYGEI